MARLPHERLSRDAGRLSTFVRRQRAAYPGSLGARYAAAANSSFSMGVYVPLLEEVHRPAHLATLFDDAAHGAVVVVHLRLGDALDEAMTTARNGVQYAYRPEEYTPLAEALARRGMPRRVVLVGSIHLSAAEISSELYKRNVRYVRAVASCFEARGLAVTALHGSSPDVDLKLFHIARHFVPAKSSGFSNVAVQGRAYEGPNLMEAF